MRSGLKPILAIFLALILLGAGSLRGGDDPIYPAYKSSLINFGVNYGYPNSQWGSVRVEVTPKGIFGYQLELGVALLRRNYYDTAGAFHLGWSVGATAYAFGHEAKFTPFLSLMAGAVARATSSLGKHPAWQERLLMGGSLSLGIRYRGAYLGYFFRRIFFLPKWFDLADMPLGGIYFGWSHAL
jgi:hypothetical protein